MMRARGMNVGRVGFGGIMALGLALAHAGLEKVVVAQAQTAQVSMPRFELDESWPNPLPDNWMFGTINGVAVDARDHVWVLQAPAVPQVTTAAQKGSAPPVLAFDVQGNVVQAWGGPGLGYSWPQAKSMKEYPVGIGGGAHGLFVDYKDNVWVAGGGHVLLKFTPAGKFLRQFGELWKTNGSNDTKLLGNPATVDVDPQTNEVYVADGYLNQRVIVFDADTGAYKRHWGAYGKKPVDTPPTAFDPKGPPPQHLWPVHCARIAKDGLVYVCDRQHSRIQVFRKDGTFVKEGFIDAKPMPAIGPPWGATQQVQFSVDPEQRYLYLADAMNMKIWILRRSDLQILGSLDSPANHSTHYIAVDSKGNLYTTAGGGTTRGPRRFLFKGVSTPATASAR